MVSFHLVVPNGIILFQICKYIFTIGDFALLNANFFFLSSIDEKLLGAESISIIQRGAEKPCGSMPVVLRYISNVKEKPLMIGGRTRINLNEELVSAGFASSHPALPSTSNATGWKPAELPKLDDVFWGHVTWVNGDGEIFLRNVNANPKFEEIHKSLDATYNGTEPTTSDLNCQKGDLCIAR